MNGEAPIEIDWREFIHADPRIADGKPVVKGTDLAVEGVLQELATGRTIAETIRRYPALTKETMRAIFELAAQSVHRRHPGPTPDDFFEGPEWIEVAPGIRVRPMPSQDG
jgi:uncharacterized protein (DUF433 family)